MAHRRRVPTAPPAPCHRHLVPTSGSVPMALVTPRSRRAPHPCPRRPDWRTEYQHGGGLWSRQSRAATSNPAPARLARVGALFVCHGLPVDNVEPVTDAQPRLAYGHRGMTPEERQRMLQGLRKLRRTAKDLQEQVDAEIDRVNNAALTAPDTRSRGAKRQARYRAKHGDEHRKRHAAYMWAWRRKRAGREWKERHPNGEEPAR
jgi:hypothetical protein